MSSYLQVLTTWCEVIGGMDQIGVRDGTLHPTDHTQVVGVRDSNQGINVMYAILTFLASTCVQGHPSLQRTS